MRFLRALANDARYQARYGFYLVYALVSSLYALALRICPAQYRAAAASVIILTDPAMLGTFFIGGIWLLERQEGLHGFWGVSPLRPMEYVASKALSLSAISTLSSAYIGLLGLREKADYPLLLSGVFAGSAVFTTIGLLIATYARSVNHYILIASFPAVFLAAPPTLAAVGVATHPALGIMPGMALWRLIGDAVGSAGETAPWAWPVLALWLGAALLCAGMRIPKAMQPEGGEKP
jgi:fluoroquinolone transport system permease protein